jgi:hypothetical protein
MMWRSVPYTEAVEMDNEWVILDGNKYMITKLNEVGGLIWNELQNGTTTDVLIPMMLEKYEITAAQAEMDIEAFLEQLKACGLIEHVA